MTKSKTKVKVPHIGPRPKIASARKKKSKKKPVRKK